MRPIGLRYHSPYFVTSCGSTERPKSQYTFCSPTFDVWSIVYFIPPCINQSYIWKWILSSYNTDSVSVIVYVLPPSDGVKSFACVLDKLFKIPLTSSVISLPDGMYPFDPSLMYSGWWTVISIPNRSISLCNRCLTTSNLRLAIVLTVPISRPTFQNTGIVRLVLNS